MAITFGDDDGHLGDGDVLGDDDLSGGRNI